MTGRSRGPEAEGAVLPPAAVEAIAAIAADRRSGARTLTFRALDVLADLVGSDPSEAAVREAAGRLEEAQPAMAALRNVVRMARTLHAEGGTETLARFVGEMRRTLEAAPRAIAGNLLKVVDEAVAVVTVSRSASVLACLRRLQARGRLRRAYVLESRPLLEGRAMAEDLRAAGATVVLAVDALGPTLCRRADLVLFGGDAILADGGVVNKVGSYGLALGARQAGIRCYVATETIKYDAETPTEAWTAPPADPSEVATDVDVEVLNTYFEAVPPALLTGLATERGVWTPARLAHILGRVG